MLTAGAKYLLGYSHNEHTVREYYGRKTEKTEPIEIFRPETKVEVVETYTSEFGEEEHQLRKFTLSNGRVLLEKVAADVSRAFKNGRKVYMSLQDEKGRWLEDTLWVKTEGRGWLGWEIDDPSSTKYFSELCENPEDRSEI
jgi:hypothetical protein